MTTPTSGNVSVHSVEWWITEYHLWRAHDPVFKGRGRDSWLYCPQCAPEDDAIPDERHSPHHGPRAHLRRLARLHVEATAA